MVNFNIADIDKWNNIIPVKILDQNIKSYKNFSENNKFFDNLSEASGLAIEIFINIANLYELDLQQVNLEKKLQPAFECLSDMQIKLPELGLFTANKKEGTVVFVDITKSTEYFEEKQNYTGFVIFNAYLLLVNTITRLTNGQFIKYTGDGALLFYPNIKLSKTKYNKNPLWYLFLASEKLKKIAKEEDLINYSSVKISSNIIEEYSLTHIGFSYGEVLEIKMGRTRDLVSPTVWDAAKNCKEAAREIKIDVDNNDYILLPIKG